MFMAPLRSLICLPATSAISPAALYSTPPYGDLDDHLPELVYAVLLEVYLYEPAPRMVRGPSDVVDDPVDPSLELATLPNPALPPCDEAAPHEAL